MFLKTMRCVSRKEKYRGSYYLPRACPLVFTQMLHIVKETISVLSETSMLQKDKKDIHLHDHKTPSQ